jgi:TonB family protein
MKRFIFILAFLTFNYAVLAQDLAYEVRSKYGRVITKDAIKKAISLSDLIEGYPNNWVKEFISVEILASDKVNTRKSIGLNEFLNPEQKWLLSTAKLDSELEINVWYKAENSVTEQKMNMNMVVKMTVVPDKQAEYKGGYEMLKQYLKENIVERVVENTPEEFQKGKVEFVIDTTGKVVDVEISASSGDTDLDNLLFQIFNKMPDWNPAQSINGEKVKQKFEFSMGIGGC